MNARRISTLARRVIRQILRDRRTIALLVLAPMFVLTLGAVLFRASPSIIPLGVVDEDEGLSIPGGGRLALAARITEALVAYDYFDVVSLQRDAIDARMRDGTVQGVLVFPADFTAGFQEDRQITLDLRLEGSDPTRSKVIIGRVTEAAMKSLAGFATTGSNAAGFSAEEGAKPPLVVKTAFLYAGAQFDTMDFIAPIYIAFLALFFVFLLSCVSFLRERSQGTLERLLATPVNRLEIVLGYLLGLGLFAVVQVAVILFFTIWALKIHYLGNLGLLFVLVVLLAMVGVCLGILASAFARNEFQVVQFIPLLILPQALLGETFWTIADMPASLRPFAYLMPITYANRALRDVMLKGWGLADIWPNLAVLAGFAVVLATLGAITLRREVA